MANDTAKIDDNRQKTLMGVTDDVAAELKNLVVDPTTKRLKVSAVVSGSGENNTASNVGAGGVGVYKQKTGVDLEFKNINAGSSKISVADDVGNDEVDIDVVEANITLGNLGGTLPTSKGGTNQTTFSADELIVADGAGTALQSSGKTFSGKDVTVITGTKGTDGNLASWNADGDAVDSGKAVTDILDAAIASDVNTGTSTTKAVTPDALAGSVMGEKSASIQVLDGTTDTSVADGLAYITIPSSLNGMDLVGVAANVITAGTTGTTDIQVRNVTDAVDMLSTKMTIDSGETSTSTAATPAVIDGTKDDVVTGDVIAIDVDAVSTTAAKGLIVNLIFRLA
jgi:hypothetical protein